MGCGWQSMDAEQSKDVHRRQNAHQWSSPSFRKADGIVVGSSRKSSAGSSQSRRPPTPPPAQNSSREVSPRHRPTLAAPIALPVAPTRAHISGAPSRSSESASMSTSSEQRRPLPDGLPDEDSWHPDIEKKVSVRPVVQHAVEPAPAPPCTSLPSKAPPIARRKKSRRASSHAARSRSALNARDAAVGVGARTLNSDAEHPAEPPRRTKCADNLNQVTWEGNSIKVMETGSNPTACAEIHEGSSVDLKESVASPAFADIQHGSAEAKCDAQSDISFFQEPVIDVGRTATTSQPDRNISRGQSGRSRSQPSIPQSRSRVSSGSPYKPSRKNKADAASILIRGSELQGMVIVLWHQADLDINSNFGAGPSQGNEVAHGFQDVDGLPQLSASQGKSLNAWQRFPELCRTRKGLSAGRPVVLMSAPSSENIRQGFVGDCSFISALSVLAEYERKFGEPVLSGLIHPQDSQGRPIFNECGKYGCRMFLNGAMRKVVIDDRVPVRRNGDLLCAHSANPREMWVTLLEKSYAKIMGSSFDIQGSNPGIDVFHLTGWIPEAVSLAGGDGDPGNADLMSYERDELFTRAERGYQQGHCVLCVGTSDLEDAEPDTQARTLGHVEGVSASTGLVAHHAYPVLGCYCIGQHRLFHLKNPWCRVRWRGRYAPGDTKSWSKVVRDLGSTSLIDTFGCDPAANQADDGHFWIGWEDVQRHFSHLYMCWSPQALGLQPLESHGCWTAEPHLSLSSMQDDTHLLAYNPQYFLRLEESLADQAQDGSVHGIWVLLSRHFKIRSELASRYVTVHIYEGSERLCCPDVPRQAGVYSNGECAFVRLPSRGRGKHEFVLVVSQYDSKASFNFSLQVYVDVPGTLTPLPPLVPKSYASGIADGEWTAETAGGCSNNFWAYFQNPHWRIQVPDGGLDELLLFVECPAEFSVNVRLFPGTSAHPDKLRAAESSGAYRQGCCMIRVAKLPEGPFVALISAFKAGLCGQYRLAWHAPKAIQLHLQPHPFAVPLQSPLQCLARRVIAGIKVRYRLCADLSVADAPIRRRTLVSIRLQCDFNQGLPPLLRLFSDCSKSDPAIQSTTDAPLPVKSCDCLHNSQAESYFTFSGASVVLLAEVRPRETCVLEAFVPVCGKGGVALYINSDGPMSLDDMSNKNAFDL